MFFFPDWRVPCNLLGGCLALLELMLTCRAQDSDWAERIRQLYHVGGTQAATPNVYDVSTVPSMREFTSLVRSGTEGTLASPGAVTRKQ